VAVPLPHPRRGGYNRAVQKTTLQLKIEGMRCNNCVRHVTEALRKVPGVERVEVSLQEGRATVSGAVPVEKLIEAVQEEGYTARVA